MSPVCTTNFGWTGIELIASTDAFNVAETSGLAD